MGVSGRMDELIIDADYAETSSSTTSFSKLQAYTLEAAEQCERIELPQFVTLEMDRNDEEHNLLGTRP